MFCECDTFTFGIFKREGTNITGIIVQLQFQNKMVSRGKNENIRSKLSGCVFRTNRKYLKTFSKIDR